MTAARGLVHLIEGDAHFAQVLAEVLVDSGYDVHRSTDAAEALQFLRSANVPALIVIDDSDLDVIGAGKLLDHMRSHAATRNVPKLSTGAEALGMSREARLPKPFVVNELRFHVARLSPK
jgi:CheY-like chemotaxis protein